VARSKRNVIGSRRRTLRILNIRKEQITKKLREGCRILWQTQADAEKLLVLLKMKSMLEAQKAVEHW
jgi:hypothetical protein